MYARDEVGGCFEPRCQADSRTQQVGGSGVRAVLENRQVQDTGSGSSACEMMSRIQNGLNS
jgi:hypothetical protein